MSIQAKLKGIEDAIQVYALATNLQALTDVEKRESRQKILTDYYTAIQAEDERHKEALSQISEKKESAMRNWESNYSSKNSGDVETKTAENDLKQLQESFLNEYVITNEQMCHLLSVETGKNWEVKELKDEFVFCGERYETAGIVFVRADHSSFGKEHIPCTFDMQKEEAGYVVCFSYNHRNAEYYPCKMNASTSRDKMQADFNSYNWMRFYLNEKGLLYKMEEDSFMPRFTASKKLFLSAIDSAIYEKEQTETKERVINRRD